MKDDNKLETAAGFNSLWDGTPIKRIRAGDGSSFMPGRRVSMHVMVQPDVAIELLSDRMLEDTGFLARSLITFPESTQGKRFYREVAEKTGIDLLAYKQRLSEILSAPLNLREGSYNELEPKTLTLSTDARKVWIKFDTKTEEQRGSNGYFSTIAGLANKLPEHAARLAAVLTLYEDIKASEITDLHMEAGIELVQYYAQEALRMKDINATDGELLKAERLMKWIEEKNYKYIPLADIYQLAPIKDLRTAKQARTIMRILEEHEYLSFIENGMGMEDGSFKKEVWMVRT